MSTLERWLAAPHYISNLCKNSVSFLCLCTQIIVELGLIMYTFSPPEDIFDVVLGCAHNKNYSGCVRNKNKNLREKGSNPMYFYAQLAKHFIKGVWLLDVSEG